MKRFAVFVKNHYISKYKESFWSYINQLSRYTYQLEKLLIYNNTVRKRNLDKQSNAYKERS